MFDAEKVTELIAEARAEAATHRRLDALDALSSLRDAAEDAEPEWEWAIRAEGDDEPYTGASDDPDWLAEGTALDEHDVLVRRVKAGPWLPAPEGTPHE